MGKHENGNMVERPVRLTAIAASLAIVATLVIASPARAAEVVLPLTAVQSISHGAEGAFGDIAVVGEVTNTTAGPVTDIRVDFDLLSAGGAVLASGTAITIDLTIEAGATAPFAVVVTNPPPNIDRPVTTAVRATTTSTAANHHFRADVTDFAIEDFGDTYDVKLFNTNSTPASDVTVVLVFRNSGGGVVDVESAPAGTLQSGEGMELSLTRLGVQPGWTAVGAYAHSPSAPAPFPGPGPFATADAFVDQQYLDFLGRSADAAGFMYWWSRISSGQAGGAALIELFLGSPEFGKKVAPVARLYFAYFLRIPDYGGLTYWVGRLQSGTNLNTISQAFASSPEFQQRYGSLTNPQFVERVYENVLGRQPDAAGLAYWTEQLNTGAATRGQVMVGFSESAEYRALMAAEINVTMTYMGMLRRAPEQGGFDFWVPFVESGNSIQQLIDGFLGSAEYAARFSS